MHPDFQRSILKQLAVLLLPTSLLQFGVSSLKLRNDLFFSELDLAIPYPFFFVIDDCGVPYVGDKRVDVDVYEKICDFARKMNTVIPCAFIMKYLDNAVDPNHAENLASFILREHNKGIEFVHHGYYHERYNGLPGEFMSIVNNSTKSIPPRLQLESFVRSSKVISRLSLPTPKLLVPSYNLWEKGLTDSIASKFGIDYLTAPRITELEGVSVNYGETGLLASGTYFLPRWYTIVRAHQSKLGLSDRLIASKSSLSIATRDEPPHNIMVHIGNFVESEMFDLWARVLQRCNDDIHLFVPRDSNESFCQWLFYKQLSQGKVSCRKDDRSVRLRGPSGISIVMKTSQRLRFAGANIRDVDERKVGENTIYRMNCTDDFDVTITA